MSHLRKSGKSNPFVKGIEIVDLPFPFYKENTAYGYAARDLICDVDKAIKILQEARKELEEIRKELEEDCNNCPPQKFF